MSAEQGKKTLVLKGIGVSPGVVIGKVYRFDPLDVQLSFYKLEDLTLIPKEIARFKTALKESERELLKIQENLKKTKVTEPLYIIDVHILILQDKKFISRTIKYIRRLGVNAEWAVRMTLDYYKQIFEGVQDVYISGRISDVQYVSQRILRNLSGEKKEIVWEIGDGVIVVTHDRSPADTAQMKMDKVVGFATDSGGRTSHTAIIARSMELPAVAGLDNITRIARTGDEIIVDGTSGLVVVNPYPDMLKRYQEKRLLYSASKEEYLKYAKLPAVTKDDYKVQIGGNIEFVEEMPSAITHGVEYIGLYRTEFIYINHEELPTEDDHFNNYSQIVTTKDLLWSTIRTFDLGGDKFPSNKKQAKELNPQLGLRAIRFCLKEVEFFSIGTNDLIQYSLAIDRANERLTYLYEPLHPAVLRLIKKVVDAAHNAKISVAMCGEMAGDPLCSLILLGLELDELSMNHLAIPRVKKIIRESTLQESNLLLKKAMSFNTAAEVRACVQEYMLERFPGEFQREED